MLGIKRSPFGNRLFRDLEKRHLGWKIKYLTEGERLTLIKSVLSSIPTYFLYSFPSSGRLLTSRKPVEEGYCGDFW